MFKIQPRPVARMSGTTSCANSNADRTCTSNITWYCLADSSSKGLAQLAAALLTNTSIGPNSCLASSTNRWRSGELVRSQRTARARPPASRIAVMVSANVPGYGDGDVRSSVRAATTTEAPSRAKRSAMAAPIPRRAPVWIAPLPAMRPVGSRRLILPNSISSGEAEQFDGVVAHDHLLLSVAHAGDELAEIARLGHPLRMGPVRTEEHPVGADQPCQLDGVLLREGGDEAVLLEHIGRPADQFAVEGRDPPLDQIGTGVIELVQA